MSELEKSTLELKQAIDKAFLKLKLEDAQKELRELSEQMNKPGFWDNPAEAQALSKRQANLTRRFEPWQRLRKEAADILELSKLADESMGDELNNQYEIAKNTYEKLNNQLRFQGEFDDHDAIISIYAGAGGTDAQDWAQMLLRMYLRWAEASKCKASVIEQSSGEEAGIKSATFEITDGGYLYGQLAGEAGVHRLVRLSPFNSDNLRQTSFAKVDVLPKIERPSELVIDEKEIKVDVFRAGGHGGQSVNTTDSAVRVTHLPSGISVAIQNERSQLQNKETALTILRSKLAQLQIQQHVKTLSELKGPNQSAEWGHQIRNYVLHPYKQVKDLRTGLETSDPEKVLNGGIDIFIEAWLQRVPS